jgi:hypothetical protein
MSDNPEGSPGNPVSLDPWQTIVGVGWGPGTVESWAIFPGDSFDPSHPITIGAWTPSASAPPFIISGNWTVAGSAVASPVSEPSLSFDAGINFSTSDGSTATFNARLVDSEGNVLCEDDMQTVSIPPSTTTSIVAGGGSTTGHPVTFHVEYFATGDRSKISLSAQYQVRNY